MIAMLFRALLSVRNINFAKFLLFHLLDDNNNSYHFPLFIILMYFFIIKSSSVMHLLI